VDPNSTLAILRLRLTSFLTQKESQKATVEITTDPRPINTNNSSLIHAKYLHTVHATLHCARTDSAVVSKQYSVLESCLRPIGVVLAFFKGMSDD